jgi:hypothetical protein
MQALGKLKTLRPHGRHYVIGITKSVLEWNLTSQHGCNQEETCTPPVAAKLSLLSLMATPSPHLKGEKVGSQAIRLKSQNDTFLTIHAFAIRCSVF